MPTCPAKPKPLDTSQPDLVVGDGTPGSCTAAALQKALDVGGTITFSCGSFPKTISLATELVAKKDTVLDGGAMITLDGNQASRILRVASSSNLVTPKLVVQRLTFSNGRAATGNGGAILREGGTLQIHACSFLDNAALEVGGTICGGAVFSGGKGDTLVVDSTFVGNSACSGGGLCVLSAAAGGSLTVLGSAFKNNSATGQGGETKTGGQGGAVFFNGGPLTLCGTTITGSAAGYLGGGLYRVPGISAPAVLREVSLEGNSAVGLGGGAYLVAALVTLADSTVSGNTGGGGLYLGDCWSDLINVTLANNKATGMGGGIWLDGARGLNAVPRPAQRAEARAAHGQSACPPPGSAP